VRARAWGGSFRAGAADDDIAGYEIHMGRVVRRPGQGGPFAIVARNGAPDDDVDGASSHGGAVVGTMLHGLFEDARVRRALVASLRARKGLAPLGPAAPDAQPDDLDRLAATLRESIDVALLHRLCRP
jgi:adenosylcobyric acid synthase